MSTDSIPYLKVMGNPYDTGFKISQHFKSNIKAILSEFEDYIKHKKRFTEKQTYIQKMLSESERLCPIIVDEIKGMADGCNIEFMDLFIHNCMHLPYWSNCSTSILKNENTIYIAHNEDAHPLLEKYAYFVFIKPENPESVPFFSHCYPGIVPGMSYGFNLEGIVQTCNSLPDPEKSIGIPRMFVGRTIYEHARTFSDVENIIGSLKPRSGGANYNICSKSEGIVASIETTGSNYAVIPINDRFFRANHYISKKFENHPAASKHTLTRQKKGDTVLPRVKSPDTLLDVMWDSSIFLTMESTNNDCATNSTLLFDIGRKEIIMKKYSNFPHENFTTMKLSDIIDA